MTQLRRFTLPALRVFVLLCCSAAAAHADGPGDRGGRGGLNPGQFDVLDQTVPVNIVFVGYERKAIDLDAVSAWLPATYVPVVRYPQFYGLNGRNLGLSYSFKYRFDFTDAAFERPSSASSRAPAWTCRSRRFRAPTTPRPGTLST